MDEQNMVDFGDEPPPLPEEPLSALEKKYSEDMRQIVTQKIDLPIIVVPGFQTRQ
jgi:hypothetical protein